MPLKSGSSQAAISANIKIERAAGKPEKQAIAIAESEARDAPRKGSIQELMAGMSGHRLDPQWLKASNNALRAPAGSPRQKEFQAEMRAIEAKYKGDCEVEMDETEIEMDSLTAEEIEAAIAAGEKELKHQKAALQSLRAMDRRLTLAYDRRMETLDGILHVYDCNITKANVCPYLGAEIPGSEALGLDPSKIYMLYRDAAELQAAVKTYDRIQLLLMHVAVNPDAPQQFITVGTISNARFSQPYIKADLTVWTREGIEAIGTPENPGKQRELSCGYHYKPDMSPGQTPEGEKYDGRMTCIVANHIALVEAGRVGPDVMVADGMLHIVGRLS